MRGDCLIFPEPLQKSHLSDSNLLYFWRRRNCESSERIPYHSMTISKLRKQCTNLIGPNLTSRDKRVMKQSSCQLLLVVRILSLMEKLILVSSMKFNFEIMSNSALAVDRMASYKIYIQHRFHLNEFSLGNSIGNFIEAYVCALEAQLGAILCKRCVICLFWLKFECKDRI